MYITINSSKFKKKTALVFYLSFAKGRVKRGFLISNISAGNITLCREPDFAHKLWFHQA
jgi:hypothetical protein